MLLLRVGVGSLLATKSSHNVYKASVVLHTALGTARLLLSLLLLLDLSTKQISFTYYCTSGRSVLGTAV